MRGRHSAGNFHLAQTKAEMMADCLAVLKADCLAVQMVGSSAETKADSKAGCCQMAGSSVETKVETKVPCLTWSQTSFCVSSSGAGEGVGVGSRTFPQR